MTNPQPKRSKKEPETYLYQTETGGVLEWSTDQQRGQNQPNPGRAPPRDPREKLGDEVWKNHLKPNGWGWAPSAGALSSAYKFCAPGVTFSTGTEGVTMFSSYEAVAEQYIRDGRDANKMIARANEAVATVAAAAAAEAIALPPAVASLPPANEEPPPTAPPAVAEDPPTAAATVPAGTPEANAATTAAGVNTGGGNVASLVTPRSEAVLDAPTPAQGGAMAATNARLFSESTNTSNKRAKVTTFKDRIENFEKHAGFEHQEGDFMTRIKKVEEKFLGDDHTGTTLRKRLDCLEKEVGVMAATNARLFSESTNTSNKRAKVTTFKDRIKKLETDVGFDHKGNFKARIMDLEEKVFGGNADHTGTLSERVGRLEEELF